MNQTVKNLYLILFLVLPVWAFADTESGSYLKIEKKKVLKKNYTVNADATLKIQNKYGSVDVISWSQNRVEIEVTITVSGSSESKVMSRLDRISVDFSGEPGYVSARTIVDKMSSGWFNFGSNVNFQIDYKVKMPVTNKAILNNDYGTITLNELKGKARIDCDYGKVIIGSLYHAENEISIDYTSNSSIDYINGGTIEADYSGLTVDKARNIELEADYTDMTFENIEKLEFECDYGKLRVEKSNVVTGNGDYLTMRFGMVFKKLDLESDYGSIRVKKIMKGFETVNINGDYTGINLGIDKSADFDFEVVTSYAGFSYDFDDARINFTKRIKKNTSGFYFGNVGAPGSGAKITIDSDYGTVKWTTF